MAGPLTFRSGLLGRAHTKIVATIGPACEHRIEAMIHAGMSVARLNLSHGTADDHRRRAEAVRAGSEKMGVPVGILADIRGPKMRLGSFPGGTRDLVEGEVVRFREGGGLSEQGEIRFDFEGFLGALDPGHRVYLADGAVELVVEESDASGVSARVRRPGKIGDRKGVHLPDTDLETELPTPEDVKDLELLREIGVDLVGVSFVSKAEEIVRVRALVPDALIVSKIERVAAIDNLKGILDVSDGVMVARGDLGVEVELEQLPLVQKTLIHDCLREGRFTITATEMLESMVTSSRPTRAEVADVANAVLDGTDALMLSAETAVGHNPVEAVATMNRIARAVEASQRYSDLPRVGFRTSEPTFSNAMALAAAQAADALHLSHIVCFTETGNTVRLISRYRPSAEIIALSPHDRTLSHMTALAHVRPVYLPRQTNVETLLSEACRVLSAQKLVSPGEEVVFVAGVPAGVARSTNLMKLHRIGEPIQMG